MMSNGISRSVPGVLAVDREGDADAMEGALGFLAFLGDPGAVGALEPVGDTKIKSRISALNSPSVKILYRPPRAPTLKNKK